MGLESLNRVANPAPVQGREASPASVGAAADDPSAFQQQLENQMGNLPKDAPPVSEDAQSAPADGKKPPQAGGDSLPPDRLAANATPASEIIALLAESISAPPIAEAAQQSIETSALNVEADADASVSPQLGDPSLSALNAAMPTAALPVVMPQETAASVDQPTATETLPSLSATAGTAEGRVATLNAASSEVDTPATAANDDFAGLLTSAMPTTAADSPVATAPTVRNGVPPAVSTPVGQHGWDREFGERIVWMAGKSLDSAEIHLNPPHLGPIDVRLNLNHDQQASIQFTSADANVCSAIEAAMPRLREMLSEQQLTLADVNVSQQSAQQQSANRDAKPQQPGFAGSGQEPNERDADIVETPRLLQSGNGLLNLYV